MAIDNNSLKAFLEFMQTMDSGGLARSRELKRDDFKRIELKGGGQHYYHSYHDIIENVEVCLEPCLNGFDIALYKNENLIGAKRCTNLRSNIYKAESEDSKPGATKPEVLELHETQERSQFTWDKALGIANEMFRAYRNKRRIERMGLIKKRFPDDDEDIKPYPPAPPDVDVDLWKRWYDDIQRTDPGYFPPYMNATAADPNKHFMGQNKATDAEIEALKAELAAQQAKMPEQKTTLTDPTDAK